MFVYQHGLPPQATYVFKHALIQEAAYQSLLKSTRQQSHQRIAQVLEAQFADTVATQPELLAYHYTEAGLPAQALPYWQRAGERALERSANIEAIGHLTKGLELLKTLPDTVEYAHQELTLQVTQGTAFIATKKVEFAQIDRRNEDDRDFFEARMVPYHLRKLKAVEFGHAYVDEHNRELVAQKLIERLGRGVRCNQILAKVF